LFVSLGLQFQYDVVLDDFKMWKLKMKFRLGHFPSLQNLFGLGLPEIVLAQ
jgi:hypothetical protein